MTKQLHFEIPDKTHEYLRKEAFRKTTTKLKVSMSDIVREAIEIYKESKKK